MATPPPSRRFGLVHLVGLLGLLALPCCAGAADARTGDMRFSVGETRFTVQGTRIEVDAPRYTVVLNGMTVVQVTDKAGGVNYCIETPDQPRAVDADCAVRLMTFMPGQVDPRLVHQPARAEAEANAENPAEPEALVTRTQVTRLPDGVEYMAIGLVASNIKPDPHGVPVNFPDAAMGMRIRYDKATGDLLLTPIGRSGVAAKNGAYDIGIDAVTFSIGRFDRSVRYVDPSGRTMPFDGPQWGSPRYWPRSWQAALGVFEAPSGRCLGIWTEDVDLEMGKSIFPNRDSTILSTLHGDAPWRHDRIHPDEPEGSLVWRLNVFDNWQGPAKRYRDFMAKARDLIPLEEIKPDWVSRIRMVVWDVYSIEQFQNFINMGIPGEMILDWRTQGWAAGYGKVERAWPNYPFENRAYYKGQPNFEKTVEQEQALGVHVFPYTNMFTQMPEKYRPRMSPISVPYTGSTSGAGRLWFAIYGNFCEQIVNDYKVHGIYDDVSWIMPEGRDPRGKMDGLTLHQSHVEGRRYLRERLPGIPFMGERQHELTLISDAISLMWDENIRHPINAYLFAPFSIRWNQYSAVAFSEGDTAKIHRALDADETMGFVTGAQRGVSAAALQEERMRTRRTLLLAEKQLKPYFPEQYEPNVAFYYRGQDGTIFKLLRDRGLRFVRDDGPNDSLVYWRLRNVRSVEGQFGIDGWVAYDDTGVIGLHPQRYYVAFPDVERPASRISRLPENAYLASSLITDRYWSARVGLYTETQANEENQAPEPQTLEIEITGPGDDALQLLGASSVSSPDGRGVRQVTLPVDGMIVGLTGPAIPVALPHALTLPQATTVKFNRSGVPTSIEHTPDASVKPALLVRPYTYLEFPLELPDEPVVFKATITDGRGAGVFTHRLLINGQVVAEIDREATQKAPLEASLEAYRGQRVLLTLETGSKEGARGQANWGHPQIVSAAE